MCEYMDTSVIDQRENKMINFMDEINKTVQSKKASDEFANSPEVKRRILEKTKKDAKGVCLDMIFSKIYYSVDVACGYRNTFCFMHPGITGKRVNSIYFFVFRQFLYNGVFASAGADNDYIHIK